MNKRHLHHLLVQLRKVSAWYFVIAIIIAGLVSVVALRQNNLEAIKLRDAVTQADEKNGDVETSLRNLRTFVYGHMNTQLASPGGAYPPVQLKHRYERLVLAEKERASTQNAKLYTEAQNYCETTIPAGRSLGRIDCIQNYVTTHGGPTPQSIPDSLYKFDFTPPIWSPDLAGWSMVLTGVLTLALVVRTALIGFLHSRLKHHS